MSVLCGLCGARASPDASLAKHRADGSWLYTRTRSSSLQLACTATYTSREGTERKHKKAITHATAARSCQLFRPPGPAAEGCIRARLLDDAIAFRAARSLQISARVVGEALHPIRALVVILPPHHAAPLSCSTELGARAAAVARDPAIGRWRRRRRRDGPTSRLDRRGWRGWWR